jgi:hypothetical protein
MSDAYMQYVNEDEGIVARWHGGEYIDIGYIQPQGQSGMYEDDFHAVDVINVWDHAENRSRIPFTLDALKQCVEAHFNGDDDDEDEDEDEDERPPMMWDWRDTENSNWRG